MAYRHRPSRDESHSDTTDDSDDEATVLTVSEARGMLRDVVTLCERQPQKKQLAEARTKAQGDPRAAMLSVVPMVVEIAEEALARRAKNKQQAMSHHAAFNRQEQRPIGAPSRAAPTAPQPLLTVLLQEAQFLVGADSSGYMKKDMAVLRHLLSPP
ncbi:unnamed protein product [Pylaiella littoralis]